MNFSISEDQFSAIKDEIVRNYKNFPLSDAHQQTRELAPSILNNVKYTWNESLDIAEKATLKEIEKYSGSLYEKTFVEAMVYGDFQKEQAESAIKLFEKKTKTKGINKKEAFELAYLEMEYSEDIQYVNDLLVNNSCFFRQYVIGKDSPVIRAKAMVIDKVLQQPFYTEMRTNQQLGYIVWSYTRNIKETYYLNFLIQSGVYPADELDRRADNFIAVSAADNFEKMEDPIFNQIIESCIEQLEKNPMSISEKATKYKTAIFEYDLNYKRDEETIIALKELEKEEVLQELERIISPETRKMINLLSFAQNHKKESKTNSSFENLEEWKSSRSYK